jgi:probable HAF family extracellular repeat protein
MFLRIKSAAIGVTALLLLGATCARPTPALAATYTLTDLGAETYPRGINDAGRATGFVHYPSTTTTQKGKTVTTASYTRAFVWTPTTVNGTTGSKIELGTLGGTTSEARAINSAGIVVGTATDAAGKYRAFIWDSTNGMRDLGAVAGPDRVSAAGLGWTLEAAYAINDRGQIVGRGNNQGRTDGSDAFLWEMDLDGNVVVTAVPLGEPGNGNTETRALNELGQVGGAVAVSDATSVGFWRASIWQSGTTTDIGFLPGGDMSNAYGINDGGQAVGYSTLGSGDFHAFLWDSVNGLRDLGTLGGTSSNAFEINNAGQVVGWAYNAANAYRAYVYDSVNGMRDLNGLTDAPSGWALKDARAINNSTGAQIVGHAAVSTTTRKGTTTTNRGFLLTPR